MCSGLTDDVAGGLEGQLYNAFVLVRGSQVEDGEDILPAWADVCCLGVNHLSYTAHNHVSDGGRPGWKKENGVQMKKRLKQMNGEGWKQKLTKGAFTASSLGSAESHLSMFCLLVRFVWAGAKAAKWTKQVYLDRMKKWSWHAYKWTLALVQTQLLEELRIL